MEQEKKLGESSKNNSENKANWIEKISLVGVVQASIATFLAGAIGIFKYIDSLAAGAFYGVPRFYFYDNLLASFGTKILFVLILIVTLFYPYLKKKFLKEYKFDKYESWVYALASAVLLLYLYLVTADLFLSAFSFDLDVMAVLIEIGIGLALAILALIAIHFKYKEFLYEKFDILEEEDKLKSENDFRNKEEGPETENKIEEKDSDGDPESKEKGKTKITHYLYGIILVIAYVLILVYAFLGFIFLLSGAKKNYEIIQDSNSEYNVIVGYHNDSAIVMKGEIKKEEKMKNGKKEVLKYLYIDKDSYRLESIDNRIIEYHNFYKVECEPDSGGAGKKN